MFVVISCTQMEFGLWRIVYEVFKSAADKGDGEKTVSGKNRAYDLGGVREWLNTLSGKRQ